MIVKQIVNVLKKLGVNSSQLTSEGVRVNCPFSLNHKKGTDSRPSMFIYSTSTSDTRQSYASCHSCGYKAPLYELARDVIKNRPEISRDILEYIIKSEAGENDLEVLMDSISDFSDTPNYIRHNFKAQAAIKRNQILESTTIIIPGQKEICVKEFGIIQHIVQDQLKIMIEPYLNEIPQYWIDRGYSEELGRKWFIGTQRNMYYRKLKSNKTFYTDYGVRLLFGIKDYQGNWVGWSARAIQNEMPFGVSKHWDNLPMYKIIGSPKYLHLAGFKRNNYLYGEFAIDCNVKTCFLTEGFFDVINLSRHGIKNVLGMFGTALSQPQIDKILQWFNRVVFIPDGDKPGVKSMLDAKEKFEGRVEFISIDPMSYWGRDPGDLTAEESVNLLKDFL